MRLLNHSFCSDLRSQGWRSTVKWRLWVPCRNSQYSFINCWWQRETLGMVINLCMCCRIGTQCSYSIVEGSEEERFKVTRMVTLEDICRWREKGRWDKERSLLWSTLRYSHSSIHINVWHSTFCVIVLGLVRHDISCEDLRNAWECSVKHWGMFLDLRTGDIHRKLHFFRKQRVIDGLHRPTTMKYHCETAWDTVKGNCL